MTITMVILIVIMTINIIIIITVINIIIIIIKFRTALSFGLGAGRNARFCYLIRTIILNLVRRCLGFRFWLALRSECGAACDSYGFCA